MKSDKIMRISLFEKRKYPYINILKGDHVVLLMPFSASDGGIALDNTCQATTELRKFFGDKGAAESLKSMSDHLKSDIVLLEHYMKSCELLERASIETLLNSKKKRLSHVED